MAWLLLLPDWTLYRVWQVSMRWTPNKVTLLRVCVGFAAVCLFGRGAWANLTALGLTVAAIALDALDGHLARKKKMATPVGAQLDILGDRMIENVYFTCAGGGDGFSARAGDEGGTFWLGRERHAAHVVGAGAGGVALEPRFVCCDEVPVFLLFGFGVGADPRARGSGG